MKIIPAIDLLDGEVVRLEKGDFSKKRMYHSDPLGQAEQFADAGLNHLHIVDLNGAKSGTFSNLPHIRDIVDNLNVTVQYGGGIRSFKDAEMLLDAGVSNVICSSMAVKKPREWEKVLKTFGSRCILGMDLKGGKIAYGGWLKTRGGDPKEFISPMFQHGLTAVLCTDIARDGTLEGPNLELYRELHGQFPQIDWIASGGVSSIRDLKDLAETGVSGVVVGKAYYEGRIGLEELRHGV